MRIVDTPDFLVKSGVFFRSNIATDFPDNDYFRQPIYFPILLTARLNLNKYV
jgi:hypothetical protein